MTQEELTVGDIERWLEKLEMLTSRGSKIIHIQQLLRRGADYIIGEDDLIIPKLVGSSDSKEMFVKRGERNTLRIEQRKRAGIK